MDHDWLNTLSGWAVAAVGAGGAGLAIRARMSRDRTQRTKDKAEADFVGGLIRERDAGWEEVRRVQEAAQREIDRLKELRQQETDLAARLSAKNDYLESEIARQRVEMASFRRQVARLYPQTRNFVETRQADLDPLDPSAMGADR